MRDEQGKATKKHIFISHSSRDEAVGRRLCASLESNGIPCWYSSRPADLDPGAEWDDNIVGALDESAAVVLLFSAAANGSKWVKRELALANARSLPILPGRLELVPPTGGMEAYLVTVQWTDLSLKKWDRSLEPIVRELKRIMAHETGLKERPLEIADREKPPPGKPKPVGRLRTLFSRPLLVLGALATVAALTAFVFNYPQPWTNYFVKEVTTEIKVCVGEYERNCGFPHDVYLYCYADVGAWAKGQCRNATVQARGSHDGNKCGYGNFSILCTRAAPK
jgi:TIR domain